jgi:predicted CoA-binding protein
MDTGEVVDASWADPRVIENVFRAARRIAVVGASPNPARPSHGVASYLIEAGYEVIPVNPAVAGPLLGRPAVASLEEIGGHVDVVDVFRRPSATPDVARSSAAIGASALWLQLGVVYDEAARIAADAGLDVVMDRCMAVEHRRLRNR